MADTMKSLLRSDGIPAFIEINVTVWARKFFDAQEKVFCENAELKDAFCDSKNNLLYVYGSGDILLGFPEIEAKICRYLDALNKQRFQRIVEGLEAHIRDIKAVAKMLGYDFDLFSVSS